MVSMNSILRQVRSLSPAERADLIRKLLELTAEEIDSNEVDVGRRGLAAWTESAKGEDWEAFYAETLRNAGRSGS